ncbi:hypothetical protein T11_1820 [Trichinella zimbabwensis]|uniref:Uncharacterized protein n=1 Tax=Trichinella zimbabwensis TaxID=268475 RepID=A0A0V1GZC7_9BILA|nr:hypothetical protein T11_1820 [Trichinella zimbabwensis]
MDASTWPVLVGQAVAVTVLKRWVIRASGYGVESSVELIARGRTKLQYTYYQTGVQQEAHSILSLLDEKKAAQSPIQRPYCHEVPGCSFPYGTCGPVPRISGGNIKQKVFAVACDSNSGV